MRLLIVGAGKVGSAVAFTTIFQEGIERVFITDINKKLLEAELLDLNTASQAFKQENLFLEWEHDEVDWVIWTAGFPRKSPKQTKNNLYLKNAHIIDSWLRENKDFIRAADVLVVTNPPKMLAKCFEKHGFPATHLGCDLEYERIYAWYPKWNEVEVRGCHEEFSIVEEDFGTSIPSPCKKAKLIRKNNTVLTGKGYTNWGIASCTIKKVLK